MARGAAHGKYLSATITCSFSSSLIIKRMFEVRNAP
jgi:hypothetical protein